MIITSTFKPFSYQELVAPVAQASEVYNQQLQALGDLDANASVWDGMLNKERDAQAFGRVQEYKNNINTLVDTLTAKGLSGTTMKDFQKAKARYAKLAKPIEEAFTQRKILEKEQRDSIRADGSMLSSIDMSNVSIDDLIDNPSIAPKNFSGNKITAMVAQQASNFARQVMNNPNEYKHLLGGAMVSFLQKEGYTEANVLEAIKNSPEASKALRSIIDNTIAATGIAGWNNPQALEKAIEYANMGLWSAMGGDKYTRMQNPWFGATGGGRGEKIPDPILPYTKVTRAVINNNEETDKYYRTLDFIDKLKKNKLDTKRDVRAELNRNNFIAITKHKNPNISEAEFNEKLNKYDAIHDEGLREKQAAYDEYYKEILGDSGASIEYKDGKLTPESVAILDAYVKDNAKILAEKQSSYAYNPTTHSDLSGTLVSNNSKYGGVDNTAKFDLETMKETGEDFEKGELNEILNNVKSIQVVPGVGFVVTGAVKIGENQYDNVSVRLDRRMISENEHHLARLARIIANKYPEGVDANGNPLPTLKGDMADAITDVGAAVNTREQQKPKTKS